VKAVNYIKLFLKNVLDYTLISFN